MSITEKLISKFNELYGKDLKTFLNNHDRKNLFRLLEDCKREKNKLLMSESFNSYTQNKNYMYFFLLENIIKSYLLEIYPNRKKKKIKKMAK